MENLLLVFVLIKLNEYTWKILAPYLKGDYLSRLKMASQVLEYLVYMGTVLIWKNLTNRATP